MPILLLVRVLLPLRLAGRGMSNNVDGDDDGDKEADDVEDDDDDDDDEVNELVGDGGELDARLTTRRKLLRNRC